MKQFTKLVLILAGVYFSHCAALQAQLSDPGQTEAPEDPVAIITFGRDHAVTAESTEGLFERIGLRPRQVVDVTVYYGAGKAGHIISASPLDGGRVITMGGELVIDSNGAVAFKFQAGEEPGTYQVSLREGVDETGLEFWVLDDKHPEKNPPVKNK